MKITPAGGRVLGCLVEKQVTTPQQYPLTKNALCLACNQTTNRDPVIVMDEGSVQRALLELKAHGLVRFVLPSHGRSVERYRHVLDEVYGFDPMRRALLAVLLLRGAQTPGELRARTGRMSTFTDLVDMQEQLETLAALPEPLVRLSPRQPGQKEDRWRQILADEWESNAGPTVDDQSGPSDVHSAEPSEREDVRPDLAPGDSEDRSTDESALRSDLQVLRTEVSTLRTSIAGLEAAVDDLRRSLGAGPSRR